MFGLNTEIWSLRDELAESKKEVKRLRALLKNLLENGDCQNKAIKEAVELALN